MDDLLAPIITIQDYLRYLNLKLRPNNGLQRKQKSPEKHRGAFLFSSIFSKSNLCIFVILSASEGSILKFLITLISN